MKTLYQCARANSVMLINVGSLVGTTAITSLLGFAYWWMAARQFSPEAVGFASAAVSAMMLLEVFCILGLGMLLITELPRQPGQEGSLISTALIVVGVAGGCIGMVFALVAPSVSTELQALRASIGDIVVFASGVGLTAITVVLDQALIGLLCGGLQFWRNTLFAVAKLVALFVVSFWFSRVGGMTIYATWLIGNVLSLMALVVFVVCKKGWSGRDYLPQWSLLRKLGPAALQHHLLNITLQTPILLLPLLVTSLLSATVNAWFYAAWMIANVVFLVPNFLTNVLHAMNAADQSALARRARVTIGLGLVTSVCANCLLQLTTEQVLSVFGSSYAKNAAWTLHILLLAVFPLIIKYHYLAICRIQDRVTPAMLVILPGALLELGGAVLGIRLGGLTGLSIGWILAICIESVFMLPTVYRIVRPIKASTLPAGEHSSGAKVWLIETSPLAVVVRQTYREDYAS